MTAPLHRTLHVIDSAHAGESAALLVGPEPGPILVLGHAREARAVSLILGRDALSAPRAATSSGRRRLAERVRMNTGAGSIIWHGAGPEAVTTGSASAHHELFQLADRLPRRASARAALGLGSELLLAPLSDRPANVDARTLLFIAGVIEIIGEPIALALPTASRRFDEAMTYHRSTGFTVPVRIIDDAWLGALPAADVLIAPIDLGDDPAGPILRAIADQLAVPVATTAAWHRDPDAATNSLPSEIRATVAPVLAQARAVRTASAGIPVASVPS